MAADAVFHLASFCDIRFRELRRACASIDTLELFEHYEVVLKVNARVGQK
jgi:hypothetical protein